MNESTFGKRLRYFRRRARDPERGGSLTQERLTHLLYELSNLEYSFAAVSDWERGKSQIPKDHRTTLIGLVATLGKYGGILSLAEANAWLQAGNYRPIDDGNIQFLRASGLDWQDLTVGKFASGEWGVPFLAPPRPFQPIVGREQALSELRTRLLDRETVTISAVRGLPGVGKTTVAQVLAHEPAVRQAFPDGVFWVGLGRNPDLFFHLGLWAEALAIEPAEIRQMTAIGMRATAVRARLSTKAALLIIDDAWEAKQAGWFRLGGKDCAHILTTRLPAVTDAFSDAHRVIVETLGENESIRLLSYLAPQVYEHFPEAVIKLAQKSGGLPLALMLIGNHLRQQAASGQQRRIAQALQSLQDQVFRFQIEMPQAAVQAHPSLLAEQTISLNAIIGLSEEALPSDNVRRAFLALRLFPPKPNSFTEMAAAAVMGQPLEVLDELVDGGLIETMGQERCQIHQAISDYLTVQKTQDAAALRFVAYYDEWLSTQKDNSSAIELEIDNLLTAVTLAKQANLREPLIAITTNLLSFLENHSMWNLVDQLVPDAVKYSQQNGNYRAAITLLDKLGRSLDVRRERQKANTCWRQALEIAQQEHEVELMVSLMTERSQIASAANQDDLAQEILQEALALSQAEGYSRGIALSFGYLGRLSLQSGNHSQTPFYLDKALVLARECNFQDLLCGLLILRGASASYSETTEDAERYYLEALELARTVGRKDQLSAILTNLGEIETNRENDERAIAYLEEALEIVQTSGSAAREAHIRKDLGILAVRQGDVANGRRHFEIALSLTDGDDNDWLAGYIEQNWAELALQTGDVDEAARLAKQVINRLPDESKNRSIVALARFVQAQIAALSGQKELARQLASQSQSSLQAVGHVRAKEVSVWLHTLSEQN